MIFLGNFGAAAKSAVTLTSATYEGTRPWSEYIVYSDRAIHLKRSAFSSTEATTDDFLLAENTYARIEITEDEFLAYVLADSETDGSIYITPVT